MKKPSVTELANMLDKPALMRWANRQGLLGIDIEKQRASARSAGTYLHDQIHRQKFENAEHGERYAEFMRDKEIISAEQNIETDWFVGRYDCKLRWKEEIYVIDYKTGGGTYFETRLQLAAYGMADEDVQRFGVVDIPKFELIDPKIERHRGMYEKVLVALSNIYALRWHIEHDA